MFKYLCYYELHVEDRTFYVHTIVKAWNASAALNKLKSQHGEHYHLQAKGCLGFASKRKLVKYMKNYLIS